MKPLMKQMDIMKMSNFVRFFFFQIVPSTLKRQTRTESARPKTLPSSRPEAGRSAEDRAAYRRVPGGADVDKRTDVGPGAANLQFVSIII